VKGSKLPVSEPTNEARQNDIRILIIDDDGVNSALAKGLLQRHGCTVEIASNPMRAGKIRVEHGLRRRRAVGLFHAHT
jgi:CheY-like chemotaxis protein